MEAFETEVAEKTQRVDRDGWTELVLPAYLTEVVHRPIPEIEETKVNPWMILYSVCYLVFLFVSGGVATYFAVHSHGLVHDGLVPLSALIFLVAGALFVWDIVVWITAPHFMGLIDRIARVAVKSSKRSDSGLGASS